MNRRGGLEFRVGLEGWMRLEVYNAATGIKTKDTGWFKNLITDQGLDAIAQQTDVMTHFHVGTSNTAPTISDTWLNAFVATTTTSRSDINGCTGSSPYYGYRRKTQRFDEGDATGNIQECAVGWSASTGTAFSHALIQDPGGSPKSITVLSNEYLDFTYELRYYPPTSDATGTCVIDGNSYNYQTRALNVTSTTFWSQYIGKKFEQLVLTESYHRAYTGALGAITATQPAGTDATGTTDVTNVTYVPGDYFMDFTVRATTQQWNVAGGYIRSLVLACKGNRWQTEFDKVADGTGIPKSVSNGLNIYWRVSWTRTP